MLPPTLHRFRLFLLLLTAGMAAGCSTVSYYTQAIGGQLDILARAQPIEDMLNGDSTPPEGPGQVRARPAPALKARLETVLRIREFATRELQLPDNGSYRSFADLERPVVAWNVIATPEFSLETRKWCFPFTGCVPYRGYFAQARAERFAGNLRAEQLDVRVASVAAYSTLGWFRDPLLNTQLRHDDNELAAILFHELAHQILFVPGDAEFNESFATAVELEGLQRWLNQHPDPLALQRARDNKKRHAEFVALVLAHRDRLDSLYRSGLSENAMRAGKREILAELRGAYAHWRTAWPDHGRYDAWFAQDLNNAHLATVGLYHRHVPAFQEMLRQAQYNMPAFYGAVRALSRMPAETRAERLAALAVAGAQQE